jgi:thioesterase domain-containing protein
MLKITRSLDTRQEIHTKQQGDIMPSVSQKVHAHHTPEALSTQTPLHTIQAGKKAKTDTQKPIFLLHGNWTGGVPFYCYTVARTLGRKQAFHALDPYLYNGPYKPSSIEEMAGQHLKAIRECQPEGPYTLAGFCNGSLIAYEIAHQLHQQGQQVDQLILIAPTNIPHLRQVIVQALRRIGTILHIQPLQQLTWFLRLRHAARHLYRRTHAANDIKIQDFPKLLAIDARLDTMFPGQDALLNDYVGVFTWIASLYQKRFIPQHVNFIWAEDELDSRQAWAKLEKSQNSPILPGHHMQCVTDYVDQLAEEIKTIMERANPELHLMASPYEKEPETCQ